MPNWNAISSGIQFLILAASSVISVIRWRGKIILMSPYDAHGMMSTGCPRSYRSHAWGNSSREVAHMNEDPFFLSLTDVSSAKGETSSLPVSSARWLRKPQHFGLAAATQINPMRPMRWSLCLNLEHIPIKQKRVPPIASHGSFGALHWPYALRCFKFFPRASFAFCILPLNATEALSWMFFVYRAQLRYDKICWNLNNFPFF